jgi:hypothetical protein
MRQLRFSNLCFEVWAILGDFRDVLKSFNKKSNNVKLNVELLIKLHKLLSYLRTLLPCHCISAVELFKSVEYELDLINKFLHIVILVTVQSLLDKVQIDWIFSSFMKVKHICLIAIYGLGEYFCVFCSLNLWNQSFCDQVPWLISDIGWIVYRQLVQTFWVVPVLRQMREPLKKSEHFFFRKGLIFTIFEHCQYVGFVFQASLIALFDSGLRLFIWSTLILGVAKSWYSILHWVWMNHLELFGLFQRGCGWFGWCWNFFCCCGGFQW